MSTLNISIPESMKAYIETQAAEGDFTTSEYVRHLIRMDQERKTIEKRAQIAQYLALCEQQITMGDVQTWDKDKFLSEAETAYRRKANKNKK